MSLKRCGWLASHVWTKHVTEFVLPAEQLHCDRGRAAMTKLARWKIIKYAFGVELSYSQYVIIIAML